MTIETTANGRAPVPRESVRDALEGLASLVGSLAHLTDPAAPGRVEGATAAAVVTEALALAGRLTAIAARTIAVVEADGWWVLDARNRSITSWVAAHGRVPHGQASRLVGLGRAMRDHLPATAAEVVAGAVSVEAAHLLASLTTTTDARRGALAAPAGECGEEFLVEHARVLPVASLRLLARRWAAQADPEADERGYRDAQEAEYLDLADTTEGCRLSGFLTTEHGHALRAALAALTDRSSGCAGLTAARKRATALTTMVRSVLDNDLTGATGTHRPQISVVADLDTLTRALTRGSLGGTSFEAQPAATVRPRARDGGSGARSRCEPDDVPLAARPAPIGDVERFAVAELVGTGPVPDSVLARLACDSTITRVVFGPQSQVLDVGRSERTYTGHKRRAIIARDLPCQAPDCDAPPALSEIHHTEHWARDNGTTDVATGCLLCWSHHAWVHDDLITVRQTRGRWTFTDRHGQPIPNTS